MALCITGSADEVQGDDRHPRHTLLNWTEQYHDWSRSTATPQRLPEKALRKRSNLSIYHRTVLGHLQTVAAFADSSAKVSAALLRPSTALAAVSSLQRSKRLLCTTQRMAAQHADAVPGTAQAGLDVARSGWFTELSTLWKGQGLSFQVEKTLFQDRSKFQVDHLAALG